MITIYVFIGLAVMFLLGGCFLILKGLRSPSESDSPVSLSNSDIKSIMPAIGDSGVSEQSDFNITEYILDENLKKGESVLSKEQQTQPDDAVKQEEVQERIDKLEKENQNLRNELEGASNKEKLENVAQEKDSKIEMLEKQVQESEKLKEEILGKNSLLEKDFKIQEEKYHQLEQNVESIKEQRERGLEEGKEKIGNLESQVQLLKGEQEKVNQSLQGREDKFKKEQDVLRSSLVEARDKISSLENELKSAKEKAEEGSNEEINILESVKDDNAQLSLKQEEDSRELEKIKALNKHLSEKEKLLKYELTKSRAQSLGLEKMCEDFKVQIETMYENSEKAE